MIRVSKAEGSESFIRPLRRAGARCCLRTIAKMPFGDFWFWGNGPEGRCKVVIERKTISELVGELGNNRFEGHQIPGLLAVNGDGRRQFRYVFLVVEGDRYIDRATGLLNPLALKFLPRKAHVFRHFQKYELSLMLKYGIIVIPTKNKTHTTEVILAIYEWFTRKAWAAHKTGYKVEETKPDLAILSDRTMKRKVANQITQLAWVRSSKASQYFPSIASMVIGDPDFKLPMGRTRAHAYEHWRKALGFKKTGKIVRAIVDVCHTREDVKGKGR